MRETVKNKIFRLALYLIFLVFPTIVVVVESALKKIDEVLIFINTDSNTQWFVAVIAITGSFICYFLRFRFIVTFPIVVFLVYSYSQGMKFISGNEFDSYFLTIRYLHLSTLFLAGWLMGYALARFRYFPLVLSCLVISISVVMVSTNNTDLTMAETAMSLFWPVVYAFYVYFIRETLENIEQVRGRHVWNLSIRFVIFILFIGFCYKNLVWIYDGRFKSIDQAVGSSKQQNEQKQDPNEENMLNKDQQEKFDMNQYSQLKPRFGTNKELLFAAYVDNFFPQNPDLPNPLYFTSYHLTKYDVKNERFIRDPKMPSNDLFAPDPSRVARYFTITDSSVIKKGKGDLFHHVVESEIYLAKLSPKQFTAPSTAFSCQPINVDPDYKEQYTFAYKTKSYVSLLNSAYFIYNAAASKDKTIMKFQEQRVEELKKVKSYKKVEKEFYDYYTEVPKGAVFDSIRNLSAKITAGAKTPIEKVLKIRDYFTSKDRTGKAMFKYTLYPGSPNDPNIPTAPMLSTFLFKNRKGYCTYFAASTLFLLRSAGVPVRMTTGFMVVDRSDKNKGWYFIYGDQAHAWVQVYFPEYGWLDFDTTIGNEDAQESPKPDGTPPMKPQKAWFATVGKVIAADTSTKVLSLEIRMLQLANQELVPKETTVARLDLTEATITKGSFNKKFKEIKIGDSVTAVSYDEALKRVRPYQKGESMTDILKRLPNPTPVDEVTIQEEPEKPKETKPENTVPGSTTPWWVKLLIIAGSVLALFLLLLLFNARIIFRYYYSKATNAKNPEEKAYWIFRASEFLFTQFGFYRNQRTPLEYAQQVIQPRLNIPYEDFVKVYHKVKYDKLPADEQDLQIMNQYHNTYPEMFFQKYTFLDKNLKFMNLVSTIKFFLN